MDRAVANLARRFRQTALKRWISRTFFQRPQDGAALWTLTPPRDRPSVDILRLGACEYREMNGCHTVTAPVGFPRYMAEELEPPGVGLGFQNIFVWHLEDWPTREMLLKRRRRQREGEPPDLVMIQVGGWSAMKHFLGFHRRLVGLREHVSRWVGPLIWPIHRCLAVLASVFGRRMPEQDMRQLEEFVAMVRDLWPDVEIAILEPWRSGLWGAFDERRLAQVTADLRDATERLGCDWVPAPDFGRGRRLRCSNGFNVNEAGSRLAARHYAASVLEHEWARPQREDAGVR